jgi:hypothetical protein
MRTDSKRIVATATAVVVASIFVWTFAQARKRSSKKPEFKVVPIQSQISVQNGETVITMSPQAQKVAGIAAAPLKKFLAREQITVPAIILSVEGLAKLRESYIAAEAQLAKAREKADVSRKEYARSKSLYENNQNVSQKELQVAEGAFHSDETDVQAAQEELALEGLMVRQKWGSVVEQWVENGDPMLERVLDQRILLVEVTVPPDKASAHPLKVRLKLPGGIHRKASFVSLFPRVDPRIQGAGLLYRISAHTGLEPGTNLTAHLAVGQMTTGVVVPSSAVVSAKGKSWVYVETAPGRFIRRPVETAQPKGKGFFVPHGFSPGDKIIVRGAQVVLSEEFRFEIQPED